MNNGNFNNDALTSVLTSNTRIVGDIFTDANIIVEGAVKGNIESSRDVVVNGTMEGNVTGANISVGSAISGNVNCTENLDIDEDANVYGDVIGNNAVIKGSINGNLTVSGKAEFTSTGSIEGTIRCSVISVEEGAIINGRLEIDNGTIKKATPRYDEPAPRTMVETPVEEPEILNESTIITPGNEPLGFGKADPFAAQEATSNPFGATPAVDPFATPTQDMFGAANTQANPFGQPANDLFSTNPGNPFASTDSNPFGSTGNNDNPFGSNNNNNNSIF